MLVSWYLPTVGFSLWPCAGLLAFFIPVTAMHERNWRRTIAAYAAMRKGAGATDDAWPTRQQRVILGVQPWLLFTVSGLLGAFALFALWALLQWPHRPPGFEAVINFYDLVYLWCTLAMALGAVAIGLAIGVEAARSPWAGVAQRIRRSMYAPASARERLLAEALAIDPGLVSAAGALHSPSASDAARSPLG